MSQKGSVSSSRRLIATYVALFAVLAIVSHRAEASFYLDDYNGDRRGQDSRDLVMQRLQLMASPRSELYNAYRRMFQQNHFRDWDEDEESVDDAEDQLQDNTRKSQGDISPASLARSRLHAVRRAYRPQKSVQDVINISFPKGNGWPRLVKKSGGN